MKMPSNMQQVSAYSESVFLTVRRTYDAPGSNQNSFTCGAGSFLSIAGASGVLDAQTQKIRIAYSSRSNTITPLYVAASKGFFREEGLEVELIQVSPRLGAMAVMNGDVSFTTSFVSTFRGILQGLPLKVILIALKRGMYFLVVRPEIKDVQDLKGKKLGVATIRGTDQLVAAELLRSKGFDPALVQQLVIGETPLRAQALASGAVQAVSVSPPYDLMLQQMGYKILAGPPEVGMPASGLFTSDRLLKENPQMIRRTLRAVMKANRFIADNRQETIAVMLKWLPQTADVAARSYDLELKAITPDGQMTDAEMESLIERLGEKKRPLDEVRDFSAVRQRPSGNWPRTSKTADVRCALSEALLRKGKKSQGCVAGREPHVSTSFPWPSR
jgi:NitT/TauT family transport system substrate-binding protein